MKAKFNINDIATLKHGDCDYGDKVKITKVVANAVSIPEEEIGIYDIDLDCYSEKQLNKPFYRGEFMGDEMWFSESDFKKK